MKRPAVGGRGSTGATMKLGSARSSNRHALPSRWCHQPRGSGPACHVCRHRHRHRWHHSRRHSWRKSNSAGKWSTSASSKYCTRKTRQNRMWGKAHRPKEEYLSFLSEELCWTRLGHPVNKTHGGFSFAGAARALLRRAHPSAHPSGPFKFTPNPF